MIIKHIYSKPVVNTVVEEKVQVEEPVILETLPEEDVFEEIILIEEDEEGSL